MTSRILNRARIAAAMFAVRILAWTGLFEGYWSPWRWAIFDRAAKLGLHILPNHYYTPIPKIREEDYDEDAPRFLAAPEDVLDAAMAELADLASRYASDFERISGRSSEGDQQFVLGDAPYSTVEAELLYALVRSRQPKRIVEVGSGKTTLLIAEAIRDEPEYNPDFTCIEPFAPPYLATPPDEVTRFVAEPIQSVDLSMFTSLEAGDILFLDSSHVVATDSDTVHEIVRVLPELAPGVLVHLHDIFLPYDYPKSWVFGLKFFWAEQYLLAAFLQSNNTFEVIFPLHQLFRQRQKALLPLFPRLSDKGQRPSAFWITRVGR